METVATLAAAAPAPAAAPLLVVVVVVVVVVVSLLLRSRSFGKTPSLSRPNSQHSAIDFYRVK